MSDYPLVGVAVVVVRDGKVLMHKRKGSHAAGVWAFPGGHLEMFESWVDCATRELEEEAGKIEVTPPVFWTVENTFFTAEGKHYVVIFMRTDWVSGEATIEEPDKCEGWEWFDWDDMPSPIMPGIQQLLLRGVNPMQTLTVA